MDPIEFLKALRRRWIAIVATLGIALSLAWLTTTVTPVGVGPVTQSYKATAVLLDIRSANFGSSGGIENLKTIAALTTVGEVPIRAAKALRYNGEPQALASRVNATADTDAGILEISATSTDPREVERIADTFAVELLGFLKDRRASTIAEEAQAISVRLNRLDGEIQALDRQITTLENKAKGAPTGSRGDILRASRGAKVRQYGFLSDRYQELASDAAETGRFVKIQDAKALPQAATGFRPPRTRTSRLLFAGVLGLVAGAGLVLVLERIDTRIRSKEDAELHFGFPVLAEIPPLPRGGRRPASMVGSPGSGPADAFRLLGVGVMTNGVKPGEVHPQPAEIDGLGGRVILVTSASAAEGKSTVVANLATVLGAGGKRVLVLSCDLRRPTVHRLLGVPNEDGIAEVVSLNGKANLDRLVLETKIPRVSIVPSGQADGRQSELLDSVSFRKALVDARGLADVVLVDTPPVLTGDSAGLLRAVDAVVIVARVGKTSIEGAERASALLRRLEAPVVGVALNESHEAVLPSRYYRRAKKEKRP